VAVIGVVENKGGRVKGCVVENEGGKVWGGRGMMA